MRSAPSLPRDQAYPWGNWTARKLDLAELEYSREFSRDQAFPWGNRTARKLDLAETRSVPSLLRDQTSPEEIGPCGDYT